MNSIEYEEIRNKIRKFSFVDCSGDCWCYEFSHVFFLKIIFTRKLIRQTPSTSQQKMLVHHCRVSVLHKLWFVKFEVSSGCLI